MNIARTHSLWRYIVIHIILSTGCLFREVMGRYFKMKLHYYSPVRTRVCLETKASAKEEFKPGFEDIRR